ncbi:MAG TPA: amidohydrolase family protein [Acidimicrobiia bacterium]|jgi:predicted TIM-barrel fold metal-dependent hydrolase
MEPYLVISSDCHAGLPTEQYRAYIDPDQRPAFDEMLAAREAAASARTSNEFADRWLAEHAEGLTGAWDGHRRDKELDADGVVGEVIFPDADAVTGFTGAPFGAGIGSTGRLDPTLALAGARAHNRWLAELCAESPVRRVGVAIVPVLDDPVAAIQEVEWAAANGLRAVMVPAMWQPYPAYHDPRYDPFWAACADARLPVHIHSGPADHEQYGSHIGIYLTEVRWWAARPLWFLIWSGVFERHPQLKFGITEGGCYWANDILWHMDTRYLGAHTSKKMSRDGIAGQLTMRPSDYFDRNCFVGASNMEVIELERRYMIGVGNMLWGNDFPHPEGTWPHTREWLRSMYHNIPIDETRQMLGLNAAAVYDFDVDALRPLAAEVGPTPAELGQVDDDANRAYWQAAKERGRFWLT